MTIPFLISWTFGKKMRPLTEDETRAVFEKLTKFIGDNIKVLVDRPDGSFCFRLHKDRVYYVNALLQNLVRKSSRELMSLEEYCSALRKLNNKQSETLMRKATNIARKRLISMGTCVGKFTKTGKFHLQVTALDIIAPYAKCKVWLKPSAEQSFLYGNHVTKSGLGRITENTEQYQGVVMYSMSNVPLGFGVAAKSVQDCRRADPGIIVAFHQSDIGEYLRSEDSLS